MAWLTLQCGPHRRINVFSEHRSVHLDGAQQLAPPAAIAPTKHANATERRPSAMSDIVHVLKFSSYDFGEKTPYSNGAGSLKHIIPIALHGQNRAFCVIHMRLVVCIHDKYESGVLWELCQPSIYIFCF
jgi:hypothetical protein